MGHTRRCLEGVGPEGGSTPPTSTTILGTLEPSKTARVPASQKSPVFGAFLLSRPAVIGTAPWLSPQLSSISGEIPICFSDAVQNANPLFYWVKRDFSTLLPCLGCQV